MSEQVRSSSKVRAPSYLAAAIDHSTRLGTEANVLMQRADDVPYVGRYVSVRGRELLNFGSCSYLGLELREELIRGATDALRRYGTQFSFSRAYLQSPLYAALESTLAEMTGGAVLTAPSTSLAHFAALPTLIREGDAVVIDRATHASVHTAALTLHGVPTVNVRHGDYVELEETIRSLSRVHRRVWCLLDGVYSMHGDLPCYAQLVRLHDTYPNLYFYIDDAHGTSWSGLHGRGGALDSFPCRDRLVVALSLNKGFAAAGGALVFPDGAMRDLVRRTGGPMLFSGPIQPPMLGVALASARLHLTSLHDRLQRALKERIQLVMRLAKEHKITLADDAETPIFFVPCGDLGATFELVQALQCAGMYVSAGMFPAVPRDAGGVRFTVSLHNKREDIERFMATIAEEQRRKQTQSARARRAEMV